MSQQWAPTTPEPDPQNPALISLADLSAAYSGVKQFSIPAEQASDAFFLHDVQGRYLDVNRQACEMLGYTREELLRMTVFDISVDHDLQSAQSIWNQIQPGKTITINSHERRKDGSVFPMEARLSGYRVKGQIFILALIRDVSERHRVEQIARDSQDQYRLLFECMDEGLSVLEMIYDDHGKPVDYLFLEVNPAFERHVGILGAVGNTIRTLAPDIESKWIEIYHEVATTGLPTRFVDESPSLNRSFDVYAFRVGQPEQRRVAVLFSNITDRIAAEKALLKSEKLALVGLLSGVISHEIRNPIDSIDNLLYLAAEETDVATIHEYVRIAKGELDRVSNIVTHTLHFNRQSDTPVPDRLSAILDSAIAVYDFRIRQSGVKLRRVYDENDTVSCLPSELRQVFANFIINAFEATLAGGTVTLKTRNSPSRKTGASGVRVSIADTGHGMDEKPANISSTPSTPPRAPRAPASASGSVARSSPATPPTFASEAASPPAPAEPSSTSGSPSPSPTHRQPPDHVLPQFKPTLRQGSMPRLSPLYRKECSAALSSTASASPSATPVLSSGYTSSPSPSPGSPA